MDLTIKRCRFNTRLIHFDLWFSKNPWNKNGFSKQRRWMICLWCMIQTWYHWTIHEHHYWSISTWNSLSSDNNGIILHILEYSIMNIGTIGIIGIIWTIIWNAFKCKFIDNFPFKQTCSLWEHRLKLPDFFGHNLGK